MTTIETLKEKTAQAVETYKALPFANQHAADYAKLLADMGFSHQAESVSLDARIQHLKQAGFCELTLKDAARLMFPRVWFWYTRPTLSAPYVWSEYTNGELLRGCTWARRRGVVVSGGLPFVGPKLVLRPANSLLRPIPYGVGLRIRELEGVFDSVIALAPAKMFRKQSVATDPILLGEVWTELEADTWSITRRLVTDSRFFFIAQW